MRHLRYVGGAALAVVLAAILWHGAPPPPPDNPAPVVSVPIPPVSGDTPGPAAAPAAIDTTGTRIADRHDTEPAEPNRLPRLPSRTVAVRPAHVVPENEPLPPPRPIDIRNPPGGVAAGAPPQAAPPQAASPQAAPAAPPPAATAAASPPQAAPPHGGVQIAGPAQVSGAAALMIFGRPIRLFGVRPPAAADRCAPANDAAALPCAEEAHRALVARLAPDAGVSCRIPTPNAVGAVCLDAQGVDLGGLLVAEGLALADPSQSYDYVGAESIARTQHRGLWLFR